MAADDPARSSDRDGQAHRLILRGGFSTGFGFALRLGARLLFVVVAARLFGAAALGAYSLAVAVVELAVAVSGLGMKRYLFKLLEEHGDRSPGHVLLDSALLVTAAGMVLGAGIALAAAVAPPGLLAAQTAAAMLWAAPMVAGQALIDLLSAATRWKHRMRYSVLSRGLVEPYVGTAVAVLAYFAGFGPEGLLMGYLAGTLAALAYTAAGTRLCFGGLGLRTYSPQPARLFGIVRESAMPTVTDTAAAFLYRADLYLVGALLGETSTGVYAMARQFCTPIRQTRQALDSLLTPLVAKTLSADGPATTAAAISSATRMVLAVQLALVLTLLVAGEPVLGWFGLEFVGGYFAALLLASAETIQGAFSITDLLLLYLRARLALLVTLAMSVVNVVAGVLLITAFGIDGAALSVLTAIASGALLRRILLRARFAVATPLLHSAGPLLAASLAAAAACLAQRYVATAAPMLDHLLVLAGVLTLYGVAILLWLRATGETLRLTGFRAA